jgi:hypothetical protein
MQGEHDPDPDPNPDRDRDNGYDSDADSRMLASAFLANVALFFLIRPLWCSPSSCRSLTRADKGAEDTRTALLKPEGMILQGRLAHPNH